MPNNRVSTQEETPPEGKCIKCGEYEASFGEWCIDCWPGYKWCANPLCQHYRCEHGEGDDFKECGNFECPCGEFVEGSENRTINQKEWKALQESWKAAK